MLPNLMPKIIKNNTLNSLFCLPHHLKTEGLNTHIQRGCQGPCAMLGLFLSGLFLPGYENNVFAQIGLVMLVGLAAKNGILIVEFANQLRDAGQEFHQALLEATEVRFRPIVMTGITTAAGAVPLLLSSGPGAETRAVMGTVILYGVLAATLFTLFVVPVAYDLLARRTGSPKQMQRRLNQELDATGDSG